MLLGFKTELKVNNRQRVLLAKHAGVSRHAWNWGLNLTKKILDNNRDYSASLNLLGLAEPEVMPVEKQEPTLFDETGTRSKTVLSNIV